MREKRAEEVVSENTALLGRSIRTIITNFGFELGANHPYEVIVCPAVPTSYFPLLAICEVPVLPATL